MKEPNTKKRLAHYVLIDLKRELKKRITEQKKYMESSGRYGQYLQASLYQKEIDIIIQVLRLIDELEEPKKP